MQRLFILIASAFLLLSGPAFASDTTTELWTVSQRSGNAQIVRPGLQPVSLGVNTTLSPGDFVVTGATGRAILTRGSDYIVVAPGSRMQLPALSEPDGFTRIIQKFGTMLYKVRKMGAPHFEVETPMLAAVVKGTSFTVIVDKDRSAVQVTEGAVEVIAASGGMKKLVLPGETIFIENSDPAALVPVSAATIIDQGSESSMDMPTIHASLEEPLSNINTLTAGLLRTDQIQTTGQPAASGVAAPAAALPSVLGNVVASVPTPSLSTPSISMPTISTPSASVPYVTVPSVTVPSVTVPSVTVPSVTVPSIVTQPATLPQIITPPVTVQPITELPPVVIPSVSIPALGL